MNTGAPGPVDEAALLAAIPTVDALLADPRAEDFRAFVRARIAALGLTEELAWVEDREQVSAHLAAFLFDVTSAAAFEAALPDLVRLFEHVEAILSGKDGRLMRLLCELALHPLVPEVVPTVVRMGFVAPLRGEAPPMGDQVLRLLEAVVARAGDRGFEVHHRLIAYDNRSENNRVHHNALIAVFEEVHTEREAVVIAARLLKMSVLYETRLAPFVLALDEAMAAGGFFKPVKDQRVGSALKRIDQALKKQLPEHAGLFDPDWVDLRNAALHGDVRRGPGSVHELWTAPGAAERRWTLDTTETELARIEALVGPMGAIHYAVAVLTRRYSLRFVDDVERDLLAPFEAMREQARAWLAAHAETPGAGS